jgi:putative ABC transport system permease protein
MRIEGWLQDVRYAWRGLSRAKTFTAAAIVTLSIGMAGTTVMFTLIQGVLLRPLPIPDEDRVIVSWQVPVAAVTAHVPYRGLDFESLVRESQLIESAAGIGYNGVWEHVWHDGTTPFPLQTTIVQGAFFRVAGVEAILGRTLSREDDREGAEQTVVISHRAWQRAFAGSPDVIGRRLASDPVRDDHRVPSRAFTVVGIMAADFEYPSGVEVWTTPRAYAWRLANPAFREGLMRDFDLIARLRPGVSIEQVTSELTALIPRLTPASGFDQRGLRTVVRPIKDVVTGDVQTAMLVLFAAVGLVLLIASANVANLFLMRGEARRSDVAVRAALGAGRARIVRHLLAESALLAMAAAGAGLLVAKASLQTLLTLVPDGLPRLESIRIDGGVFAFSIMTAFAVAAGAGLVPAVTTARLDLAAHLRSGGRGTAGASSRAGRRVLVVAQVALAVTTVAAAGLVGRSLMRLQTADMGLAADRLVVAAFDVPPGKYEDVARTREFLSALVQQLEAIPGIESATPINAQPFAGTSGWDVPRFTAEGQTADRLVTNPSLNLESVHPGYFATLQIPIVSGRAFTAADREATPRATIVSRDLAEALWPGQDPVGKRMKMGGAASQDEWWTVVGVAAVTRYRELATPRPTMYVPAEQFMMPLARLAIRASAPLPVVADTLRARVRSLDPEVAISRIDRFSDLLAAPLARPRFTTLLIGIFGTAALLLATVGIYAVMAAFVRQRHAEIGVRMALGAAPADIRRLVLGEGLRLALAGGILGLAGAAAGARLLQGLLFDIHPLNPETLVGAVAVLLAAAAMATYLPARRAALADPVTMLRAD